MKNKFVYLIILCSFLFVNISGQSNKQSDIPERIILNLTESPSSSIAVTWRTNNQYDNSEVQFAELTPWTEFEKNVVKSQANPEKLEIDGKLVFQYSAVINNLKPNSRYLYRVGNSSAWSEWCQFKTADEKNSPFKFVYFGDPQNDIKEHVSRVFREAFKTAPDADFWLIAGDLTTDPEDELWDEWFYAAGFIHKIVPSIMVPGNHDYASVEIDGKKQRTKELPLWRPTFTLPQNGLPGLEETSYYIDYQDVRFIMLNSNNMLKEQAEWMDKILANNPNKWTIVSFHHPLYSGGRERDSRSTRDAFLPLFDKYNVDLVLQGHDHIYARTHKLKNSQVVNANEKGTVYVTSVSGPKQYEVSPLYKDLFAKSGGNVQLFQVITVDGGKIKYESINAAGELYDSFELIK